MSTMPFSNFKIVGEFMNFLGTKRSKHEYIWTSKFFLQLSSHINNQMTLLFGHMENYYSFMM